MTRVIAPGLGEYEKLLWKVKPDRMLQIRVEADAGSTVSLSSLGRLGTSALNLIYRTWRALSGRIFPIYQKNRDGRPPMASSWTRNDLLARKTGRLYRFHKDEVDE